MHSMISVVMPTPKHSPSPKRQCEIAGCSEDGARSVPAKKLEKAGMETSKDPSKNAHICRTHYKEFKKKTKKERALERLGW
jgi:hypothetical protein